jgi:hypothetical protein
VRGGHRHVVVEAEAHRPAALGMVTRRSHQRDRRRIGSTHDAFDGVDRGAGGEQRDLVRLGRCEGVGIESDRLSGSLGDPAQILDVVHARQLFMCGRPRRYDFATAVPPAAGDHVHHLRAFRALGVPGRRLVFGERRRRNHDE